MFKKVQINTKIIYHVMEVESNYEDNYEREYCINFVCLLRRD
ncbi:MAG: hypothetical protein ACD_79C00235G0006 [uncultured bacterium]|nr:MAG: hypothetical protein ACD_79C00235G0006 [uncultured bacterium]